MTRSVANTRLLQWIALAALAAAGCSPAAQPAESPLPPPSALPTAETLPLPVLQRTYLVNPGVGWQWDGEPPEPSLLPETVTYAVRRTISWDILNPAQGLYEWLSLDSQLAEAAAGGRQFSFRVYTMAGEGFGGQKVPRWVLDEGAALLPSGEPDYSNCVYQQRWGEFVDALVQKYDGDPRIAFIDISGYGNFNEWSWQDQTEWDEAWKTSLGTGRPDPAFFRSLDGQARRRLADMFIGGSFSGHACRDGSGRISSVDYSYGGFRLTQLVMPFAGINQSSQYVYSRRGDAGFRYDCLGKAQDERLVMEAAGDVWKRAPVVFELCDPGQFSLEAAQSLLRSAHGSLVHANGNSDPDSLMEILLEAGYRYVLKSAEASEAGLAGRALSIRMIWQNAGLAPSYPRMGQRFRLHVHLVDGASGRSLVDEVAPVDVSSWMPAEGPDASPPENEVRLLIALPESVPPGSYELKVAIVDERTGLPIQLGFEGGDGQNRYLLGRVKITK